ncbi:aflatoxin B1-aldehyde reductase [Gloeopeniophorella convolvens]|nr:aflatoxin B1-aldehyde reductase [Gloeopeniophorella convolvens]
MTAARIPAIFGTATFGTVGGMSKIGEPAEGQKYIDILVGYGYNTIDTARVYGYGTSEEIISKLDLKGASVDTKIWPNKSGDHAPERLKELVKQSVAALNGVKIRILYRHSPDKSVPYKETARALDELHKEGVLWVSEIATICRLKGYVPPTVYQGVYNFLDRVNEAELFPCLRRFNIRFAAFSPLAGGLLTGFSLEDPKLLDNNMRFNPDKGFPWYITRYTRAHSILRRLHPVVVAHGLTLREVAIRWLVHHSQLRPDDLGVIYGASKLAQLEEALDAHTKGPLPEEVLAAVEQAWLEIKPYIPSYSM